MINFDLTPRRCSYDEIAAWPDEARRELDDGTLILLYAPGLCPVVAHSRCVSDLMSALQIWREDKRFPRRHGEIVLLVDWQLDEWNSVAPDLSFYRDKLAVRADGQCLISAPDLTIEVWDGRTDINDTVRKPALYARQGVPEFWLINPQLQTVLVHQNPTADGYTMRYQLTFDDLLTSAVLPGFQLSLDQIFD